MTVGQSCLITLITAGESAEKQSAASLQTQFVPWRTFKQG